MKTAVQEQYRIVLLGPQGSGKGTQATALAQWLRLPHISTGDMFRNHLKHRTRLGKKVSRLLDAGKLVPDAITNQMLALRLRRTDCRQGFILDGFPRTLLQARFLQRIAPPTAVICLVLSDREAVVRLSGRRMAPDGAIYHLRFNPPPKRLRGTLLIRDDDRPAAVRRRLKLFRAATAPLIRFYESRGTLHTVDARPPIVAVTRSIRRVIESVRP